MSISRIRKEAAKRLGLEMARRQENLQLAVGEEEIVQAATELGSLFQNNVVFIVWTLKEYGGVQQPPYQPDETALPKTPESLLQ